MTQSSLNCWEFMRCGREPGGIEAARRGVCPAAIDASFDGLNGGRHAGRICWAVAGTCCGGKIQGSFAEKRGSCVDCEFFQQVRRERSATHACKKFLRYLCDGDHAELHRRLIYRRIRQGQRFLTQGQVADCAYIIETGSCLLVVEKDGELHPVDDRGEGDIVGELSILTGEPQNAHVEAQTDMGVWVLDRARFQDLSSNHPQLLEFFTELVADRLDSRRPMADRQIGKYVATEILGRGGYSIVYKGHHRHLNLPVAIKMLKLDMALREDFLGGFWNEARTIARLNHDNIVRVYDIEQRYRTLFIIMEYLQGESLAHLLARSGRLDSATAARLLAQVCDGLEYAHQRHLIHGDINPTNITVCADRRVKILDFGLSCPVGSDDLATFGTVAYSAPELIVGDPVDQRTDIYSTGIMAYEMVTGTRPFPEHAIATLMHLHVTEEIPDPAVLVPGLDEALRTFILKACRRDPADRYPDLAAAKRDLARLAEGPNGTPAAVSEPATPPATGLDVIAILIEEHALIRRFLDCLVLALEHLDEGARVAPDVFTKAVRFARDFADRYHHLKEECTLFTQVAQQVQGELAARCEDLLRQHESGRNHMVAAAKAIDPYAHGSVGARARLSEHLGAYVKLLRKHIHTEDYVIFPLISQHLTEADQRAMSRLYRQDAARFEAGFAERCRELVDEMGALLAAHPID